LTEVKQNINSEFMEFFYVFQKEETNVESIKTSSSIPFTRIDSMKRENAPINKEPDPVEKKRALKRWKQSFGYYCHHPEKFRFGIKNLK
jgi:hypothetical protein